MVVNIESWFLKQSISIYSEIWKLSRAIFGFGKTNSSVFILWFLPIFWFFSSLIFWFFSSNFLFVFNANGMKPSFSGEIFSDSKMSPFLMESHSTTILALDIGSFILYNSQRLLHWTWWLKSISVFSIVSLYNNFCHSILANLYYTIVSLSWIWYWRGLSYIKLNIVGGLLPNFHHWQLLAAQMTEIEYLRLCF